MSNSTMLLGVNIDHVATLRQARGTYYPDPIQAAIQAEEGGADGITLHLREDRRHIQDSDVERLKSVIKTRMNLEMAATKEMVAIALRIKPEHVCLVPEKRSEITTEGGMDVISHEKNLYEVCCQLNEAGIMVSLFIDPDFNQIEAAIRCTAPVIEIHTGYYADAETTHQGNEELKRIKQAVSFAIERGLIVNAGHGLHYENVSLIAQIPEITELNIGHSIVARAVFIGIKEAVKEMKALMR